MINFQRKTVISPTLMHRFSGVDQSWPALTSISSALPCTTKCELKTLWTTEMTTTYREEKSGIQLSPPRCVSGNQDKLLDSSPKGRAQVINPNWNGNASDTKKMFQFLHEIGKTEEFNVKQVHVLQCRQRYQNSARGEKSLCVWREDVKCTLGEWGVQIWSASFTKSDSAQQRTRW